MIKRIKREKTSSEKRKNNIDEPCKQKTASKTIELLQRSQMSDKANHNHIAKHVDHKKSV